MTTKTEPTESGISTTPSARVAPSATPTTTATPVAAPASTAAATAPARPAQSPSPVTPPGQVTKPAAPKRGSKVRLIVVPILLALLAGAGYFGYHFYEDAQLYVSTENATITGQPVQVGSLATGRVARIVPRLGGRVQRGQVIAQVALPSEIGTYQNGTPRMGFLGASDSLADVQAPIDGIVIALPAAVGDTVAPGQPVVTLVDPKALWVNANVEETHFGRLQVGQKVDVHVDALNATVNGTVEQMTPATASTFSLLPSSNASGNFNKVAQLVPIRIAVDLGDSPMLLGGSVEVRIHVAE